MGSLFPMIFKNKSSPLRRLIPIEILATRLPLRRSCTLKSSSSKHLFLPKICCQSRDSHFLCQGTVSIAFLTLSFIQLCWSLVRPAIGISGPTQRPFCFFFWIAACRESTRLTPFDAFFLELSMMACLYSSGIVSKGGTDGGCSCFSPLSRSSMMTESAMKGAAPSTCGGGSMASSSSCACSWMPVRNAWASWLHSMRS